MKPNEVDSTGTNPSLEIMHLNHTEDLRLIPLSDYAQEVSFHKNTSQICDLSMVTINKMSKDRYKK